MITGIHHVQLTVAPDTLEACRRFYAELLGMQPKVEPFGIDGFWFGVAGSEVHVRIEDGVDRHRTRAHPAFIADDLLAAQERLVAAGYALDHQKPFDGYTRFHVIDPSGNRIELMQKI